MKKIVMTGGGTAGHVTPNIAMIPKLKELGYEIEYIGSIDGIEKQLINNVGIQYHGIKAGKLRRYFDFKNLTDGFKIISGFTSASILLKKIKPNIVFSKGGYVTSPIVWAAWLNRIPVVMHESDITPGLANKLGIPFANKVCYSFPETKKYLPEDKSVHTGVPVRRELLKGDANKGKKICGFTNNKPIILVIGGSLGSVIINNKIRENIDELLEKYQICHICGKGNIDNALSKKDGYKQLDYVGNELSHIFAMSDVIISRAGATVLNEILYLKKPNLLIPLSKKASRGDQILNANSFEKQGFSLVLQEEELESTNITNKIDMVYNSRKYYIDNMKKNNTSDGVNNVIEVIEKNIKTDK